MSKPAACDFYLVNDVGVLKLRTLLMAVVICRLGPAALEIPLLQVYKNVLKIESMKFPNLL